MGDRQPTRIYRSDPFGPALGGTWAPLCVKQESTARRPLCSPLTVRVLVGTLAASDLVGLQGLSPLPIWVGLQGLFPIGGVMRDARGAVSSDFVAAMDGVAL